MACTRSNAHPLWCWSARARYLFYFFGRKFFHSLNGFINLGTLSGPLLLYFIVTDLEDANASKASGLQVSLLFFFKQGRIVFLLFLAFLVFSLFSRLFVFQSYEKSANCYVSLFSVRSSAPNPLYSDFWCFNNQITWS
jgi:hypothetical protein